MLIKANFNSFIFLLLSLILLVACCKQNKEPVVHDENINLKAILEINDINTFLKEKDFTLGKDTLEAVINDEHIPDTIQLYSHFLLSKKIFYQSKWVVSDSLFRNTLNSYLKHYDREHPMVLETYNWLALSYSKRNLCDSLERVILITQDLLNTSTNKYSSLAISMAYKNIGLYHLCTGDYEKMKKAYHESYNILAKVKTQYQGEAAWALVNLASCYLHSADYWTAIEYNKKALPDLIEVYRSQMGEGFTATVYNNLGYCYNEVGNFDLAINNLKKAIDSNLRYATIKNCHAGVAANFKNIALSNEAIGDLQRAKTQFEIALNILKEREHDETVRAGQVRLGLVRVFYALQEYDEAYKLAKQALYIEQNTGRENELQISALLHTWLGKICLQLKKTKAAEQSFTKATSIYENNPLETRNLLFDHIFEMGISYTENQLFEEAIAILLDLYSKIPQDYAQKSRLGLEISRCYIHLENLNKTEWWLEYTMNNCKYNSKDKDRLDKQYDIKFILPFFKAYADYFIKKYDVDGNKKNLLKSIFYLEEATNYVYQQRNKLQYTSYLHRELTPIQEMIIKLYRLAGIKAEKENVFRQFEMAKAIKLFRDIKNQNVMYSDVSQDMSNRIKELEVKIRYYETMVLTDGDKSKYIVKLELTAKELEEVKTQIRKQYPDFYNYYFEHKTISLDNIQQRLKEKQILIEYFWGDKEVQAALVTKEEITIKSLGDIADFQLAIQQMLNGIHNSHKVASDSHGYLGLYVENAFYLHNTLIKPFYPLIKNEENQLIIIPDGELNLVPFNALIQSKPSDYRKQYRFDYLLHRFSISMGYSATLQFDSFSGERESSQVAYLGFAPFASSNKVVSENRSLNERLDFNGLPFSKLEVKTGVATFDGISYLDSMASKERFLAEARNAKILHCATHALGNDKNGGLSYLLFSLESERDTSERIYANEIYDLELNADLVILGACQSAKGEYSSGEGVISLTHAFRSAGASSVCSTFWNLNDEASYEILSIFFKELSKGVPRNIALHNAQIQFIDQNPEKASPYYWALFSLYGNTDRLFF